MKKSSTRKSKAFKWKAAEKFIPANNIIIAPSACVCGDKFTIRNGQKAFRLACKAKKWLCFRRYKFTCKCKSIAAFYSLLSTRKKVFIARSTSPSAWENIYPAFQTGYYQKNNKKKACSIMNKLCLERCSRRVYPCKRYKEKRTFVHKGLKEKIL